MDTEGGLKYITGVTNANNKTSVVDISEMDLSSSSKTDLVKLVMQASQQP